MLKIIILALLVLVAVTSATLCCSSDSPSSNTQKVQPKKAANSRATRTLKVTASPPIQETQEKPTVPATQVLVLKANESIDRRLILDRQIGRNLDWRFISRDKEAKCVVFAHKSIVFKYSNLLKSFCENSHESGKPSDMWMMYYPVPIIESLVNLMYEHKTVINTSDYKTIMAAAKSIQIDKLIGTSESNGESVVAKKE